MAAPSRSKPPSAVDFPVEDPPAQNSKKKRTKSKHKKRVLEFHKTPVKERQRGYSEGDDQNYPIPAPQLEYFEETKLPPTEKPKTMTPKRFRFSELDTIKSLGREENESSGAGQDSHLVRKKAEIKTKS